MKKTSIEKYDKNGTLLYVGDIVNDFGGGVYYRIEVRDDGVTTKYTGKYKKVGSSTRYGEIVMATSHSGESFIGIRTNPKVSGMDYAYRTNDELSFGKMEKVGDMENDSHLMLIDTRDSDEELEKLLAQMRKEHLEKPVEEDWGYYLMSEDMFKTYQPTRGSKPLCRKGYIFDESCNVYIGYLDFEDFQDFYATIHEDYKKEFSLWIQEITDSNISNFDIMDILKNNLFEYIFDRFGVSNENNICAIIGAISKEFGMNPIELFDYINENSQTE